MGLFLFGLYFWIFVPIALILIIFSLEKKDLGGRGATFVLIGLLTVLYYVDEFNFRNLLNIIIDNPVKTTLYFLGYIFIGIVWSFIKWYYHLLNFRDQNPRNIDKKYIPSAKHNKGTIISWMTYWPMSAIWTLINDPFRRMYNRIFIKMESVYNKISDRVFKDV